MVSDYQQEYTSAIPGCPEIIHSDLVAKKPSMILWPRVLVPFGRGGKLSKPPQSGPAQDTGHHVSAEVVSVNPRSDSVWLKLRRFDLLWISCTSNRTDGV